MWTRSHKCSICSKVHILALMLYVSVTIQIHLFFMVEPVSSEDTILDLDAELSMMEEDTNLPPLQDSVEDSMYVPFSYDSSCNDTNNNDVEPCDGWSLPNSTIETETIILRKRKYSEGDLATSSCDLSDFTRNVYGGEDPDNQISEGCEVDLEYKIVDKHWGSDEKVLKLRDALREAGYLGGKRLKSNKTPRRNRHRNSSANRLSEDNSKETEIHGRPPIFLMPGLASTRLVSWSDKVCQHPLVSDIKMQDYIWLNVKSLIEMAGIDGSCWLECVSLGKHQRDTNGCRVRPDEGLDAIASLSPGSLGSDLLVGGTNTVYAWLIQWLAENLGYDVSSIIGLPYDWRLSPDVMEERDGYFTNVRHRIEAAVSVNGGIPGVVVAHSMGNLVFRHFLDWLEDEFIQNAYNAYKDDLASAVLPPMLLPGWLSNLARKADDMRARISEMAKELNLDSASSIFKKSQESDDSEEVDEILWEIAKMDGIIAYREWLTKHIWTYVGLGAPMLGAPAPTRSVISGETMGLPMTDKSARDLEITFGSTHTANVISTKMGFCYPAVNRTFLEKNSNLACLDEVVDEIESSSSNNAWKNFEVLRLFLKDRIDWGDSSPIFQITKESCFKGEKSPCNKQTTETIGPLQVQSGEIFDRFADVWKEDGDPLLDKKEQLIESFWDNGFGHILSSTWERPHIKHVIMAYGVDIPTEIGFHYQKREEIEDNEKDEIYDFANKTKVYDDMPHLKTVIWEGANGDLIEETYRINEAASPMFKRKPKKELMNARSRLPHGGDGSIPYISLAWAHTWLLHTARAYRRKSTAGEWITDASFNEKKILKNIVISHRPKGGSDWIKGPFSKEMQARLDAKENGGGDEDETGHPHGTKYKPGMLRYQSKGRSRETGVEYTTTVIEAIGVEHKETTRNYDILAAVFTDIVKYLHDDFGII